MELARLKERAAFVGNHSPSNVAALFIRRVLQLEIAAVTRVDKLHIDIVPGNKLCLEALVALRLFRL